uniref:DUF6907 domain-containing protein n=1 Tax=Microbacterium proteolyticum TaxID=1572644 RepID=UPI003D6D575E
MPLNTPSGCESSCPAWCSGDHEGQDLPSDRYHQSVQTLVPVVIPVRLSNATRDGEQRHEAAEFSLQASQSVSGDRTVWVAIVGERQFIDVTLESAARIHTALGALLDQLRGAS